MNDTTHQVKPSGQDSYWVFLCEIMSHAVAIVLLWTLIHKGVIQVLFVLFIGWLPVRPIELLVNSRSFQKWVKDGALPKQISRVFPSNYRVKRCLKWVLRTRVITILYGLSVLTLYVYAVGSIEVPDMTGWNTAAAEFRFAELGLKPQIRNFPECGGLSSNIVASHFPGPQERLFPNVVESFPNPGPALLITDPPPKVTIDYPFSDSENRVAQMEGERFVVSGSACVGDNKGFVVYLLLQGSDGKWIVKYRLKVKTSGSKGIYSTSIDNPLFISQSFNQVEPLDVQLAAVLAPEDNFNLKIGRFFPALPHGAAMYQITIKRSPQR